MFSRYLRGCACLVATLAAPLAAAASLPPDFVETEVASALVRPTAMAFAPDGRLFVAEQGGALRVIKNGALLATPFVSLVVDSSGERGLLGVAFDPDFATDGFVYLYYTVVGDASDPEGPKTNQLVRFTADGDRAFPGSQLVLLGTVQGGPAAPSCDDQPAGSDSSLARTTRRTSAPQRGQRKFGMT